MGYRLAADAIVVIHLAFVAFAVLGGLLVLRRPRLAWLHLPAVLWAALVEIAGWVCPLTPLEVSLRIAGGGTGYAGDFIGRYVLALLYPAGLTRGIQILLGALVIVLNAGVYFMMWRRRAETAYSSVRRRGG